MSGYIGAFVKTFLFGIDTSIYLTFVILSGFVGLHIFLSAHKSDFHLVLSELSHSKESSNICWNVLVSNFVFGFSLSFLLYMKRKAQIDLEENERRREAW